MRRAWLAVLIAACESGPAPECITRAHCAPGYTCVNSTCMLESVQMMDLDSGIHPRDFGFAAPDAKPGDTGAHPDAAAPDLGFADSGPDAGFVLDARIVDIGPDGGVWPDAQSDAGVWPDAQSPDTGVWPDAESDAGVWPDAESDAGVWPDAQSPDAGPRDAGPPPLAQVGVYDYARVLTAGIPSNAELTRIAISPDDRVAIVSARYDRLYVLDIASNTATITIPLPKDRSENLLIEAIAHDPTGELLLVAATAIFGTNNVEGRLYRAGPRGEGLVELSAARGAGRWYKAIAVDRWTGEIRIVGHNAMTTPTIIYLHRYDDSMRRLTTLNAANTSAGCTDGTWANDGLGGRGLVYVCGINGITLGVFDSTGVFVNGPGFGAASNTFKIEGRPQGDYALAVEDGSTSKLSRFELGVWTTGFSALNVGHVGMVNLAFSDDGARALVVGNYTGTAIRMKEYRHGFYSASGLTDVAIPNFNLAPWLGTNGVLMSDVAWRPGKDCGYVVGGCSGVSCTRGYLVRFTVLNGRGC